VTVTVTDCSSIWYNTNKSEVRRAKFYTGSRGSFRLSNLYGYVRVPVCGHSSVCLCATIYVSRPFTSVFIFFNI
jgi:hypothetical protein